MRLAVGHIVELVRPDGRTRSPGRQRLGQPPRIADVVVGVAVGHGGHLDEFGPGEPDHVLLFLALGVRDDDDGAIAERRADQREADPGIAGRPLDDRAAGGERATGGSVADDRQGGAVLDRPAGVHEFRLGPDLAARGRRGTVQADEGRPPHGGGQVAGNDHRPWASPFPVRGEG